MPENAGLLSHFYLQLDGADAPPELRRDLLEITVESSLHLPDMATLVFHDPRLRWIDDQALTPGTALRVSAKSGRSEQPLFDGEIVELEPAFGTSTQRLTVRAFDRLHRLARGRHVRSFQNMTDGDLVQKLAQEVGLAAQVGPTSQVHAYLFQANETNLALLQRRANALGYLLFVDGTTLHCAAPSPDGQPVALHWGDTLGEFRPRLTTIGQVTSVTVRGWDPITYREIVGQADRGTGAPQVGEARSGGDVAERAFAMDARQVVADRPIRTQAGADELAKALADRNAGRFIEAEGRCGGNPAIVAGTAIQVGGAGRRFSGTYVVTSATHSSTGGGGYTTQFSISGLRPATLLSLLAADGAEGPAGGPVIGIVTDNQDPLGLGRVKLKYPWLSADHASDWARVVVPGGGATRGLQFLPEVNDEVLVDFEMGDIHHPYVLGGLWNGQDAPPQTSDQIVRGGQVQRRIIRSRAGHTITLDDSDGGGGITIEDRNGNRVLLDSAANALTIELLGNATLQAQGNLTLEAQGQVAIKGLGIKLDGGAATVDVTGSIINLN